MKYTGLQEKLQISERVAEKARKILNDISDMQTTEARNGTSYREISKATHPAWEAAWDNNARLGSYWEYDHWIWRIQNSLEIVLSKQNYSPRSERKEMETRRTRRKTQSDNARWQTPR